MIPWRFILVAHVSVVYSFCCQGNSTVRMLCLPAAHEHLGIFHFWLLWIKLLWTFLCKLLCEPKSWFLQDNCLGAQSLSCMAAACLSPETAKCFKAALPSTFLSAIYKWSNFSASFLMTPGVVTAFRFSRSDRGVVVSHCSFNLHFPSS